MRRGNSTGGIPEDYGLTMRLHDISPAPLRTIGCYTVEQTSSAALIEAFIAIRRHTRSDRAAAAELGRQIVRGERTRTLDTYGPDHPEARQPMARRA